VRAVVCTPMSRTSTRPTNAPFSSQRSTISPALHNNPIRSAASMHGKVSRRVFSRRSPNPNHAGLSNSISYAIQGGAGQRATEKPSKGLLKPHDDPVAVRV
jgi:hypothetical protein